MATKKELEKNLDYSRGYRDALVDTWEIVIKLATRGYSSRELQIMSKTQSLEAKTQIEQKIAKLEADFAQDDIIDIDEEPRIIPVAEPKITIAVNMKPGMTYLVKEPRPSRCYMIFEKEIQAGKNGLCVSRTAPSDIRGEYDIGRTQVIWLTSNEKMDTNLPPSALGMADDRDSASSNDEYIQPSNLPMQFSFIINFLDGNKGGIIVMEGLEYLISHNSFKSILNFLQKINENIKQTKSNLVVSINPSSFDPKQLSQLETEMGQVLQ